MTTKPSVLFVCVSNRGKSQMAEAIMRHLDDGSIEVHSAGTRPSQEGMNAESVAAVGELGADMSAGVPKGIDADLLRRVDRVIILGSSAKLDPVPGMRAAIETWETVEPSADGIEGMARMRLIRDDIAARVIDLRDAMI